MFTTPLKYWKSSSKNARAVDGKEIGMEYDVFLSYARKDDIETVRKVYEKLCESGLKVWWDMANMTQRELAFTEEIGQVIKNTERLVLFVGDAMPSSEYVDAEWRYARKCGVKVYPVLYACDKDDPDKFKLVPQRLRRMHIRDLTGALSVDEEIEKLIEDLNQPLPALAPLLNVPALPAGYVERESILDTLVEHFFGDRSENIGEIRFCSVSGMGGAGKSTVASALCHDEAIRRQFEEIIWVRLGDSGTLIDAWRQIAVQCSLPLDLNELEMRIELTKRYERKTCLFVFDNCTDAKIVEFLKNALDTSRNRVLLTFRENTLSNAFGIKNYPVANAMTKEEALRLLAGYCRVKQEDLGEGAERFIDAVGKHALALSIGAAMYLEFNDWDIIAESYAEAEAEFEAVIPNYEYKGVMASIDASAKNLTPEASTLFRMLAVFPHEISIPVKQVTMLWEDKIKELYAVSAGVGAKVFFQLKSLHNKSLIVYDAENKCVTLHNLVAYYLSLKQDVIPLLAPFVEKISANKDEYYYEYILYHLIAQGKEDEARKLLFSYDYQFEKIGTNGLNSLMCDFKYWNDAETDMLRMFYKLSAPIIKADRRQIAAQLFGRFQYPNDLSGIHGLMMQAYASAQRPFLCPSDVCMMPPGTAETDVIALGETAFSLRCFDRKLYVADKSGAATVIDPKTCEEEKSIQTRFWCIDAFRYADYIVSVYDKNKVKFHDLRSDCSVDVQLDGLISSWATIGDLLYIGDTTGKITRFNRGKQESQICCAHGISCLYAEQDGTLTVNCINKARYRLGAELTELQQTEYRIIKKQGEIELSSHGRLYINGEKLSGTGRVKDFDENVYINNRNEIVVFNTKDGSTVQTYRSSNELRTVCRTGDYVFTGDNNRNLYKWDMELPQLEVDHTKQWINSMAAYGNDLYYVRQDGSIYKNEMLLAEKKQWYNALVVTEEFVITADNVGEIIFFDKQSMECVHNLQYGNKITAMAVDGNHLFISDGLGIVSVLDLDSRSWLGTHKVGSWITSISVLDSILACSDRYGHIMLYDSKTMTYLRMIDLHSEIACMTCHRGHLAVAFKEGSIRMINVHSGEEVCTYNPSLSNVTALHSFEETLYVCTEVNWQRVKLVE